MKPKTKKITQCNVVVDIDPVTQAKLDLIEKKICWASSLERYWVATFVNGAHLPRAGLYPKGSSDTMLFRTVEDACNAAFNPRKYNAKWGDQS